MSTPRKRTVPPTKRSFRRSFAEKPWSASLVRKQNMLRTVTSVERYLIVWYFYRNGAVVAVFLLKNKGE